MPRDPARGLFANELTDREGRKVRDLDRVGAMTPDTDSEKRATQPANPDAAPELVDADEDRPDDQPR